MKKLIAVVLFAILASCQAQKKPDKIEIAKQFLEVVKTKNYDEIRKHLVDKGFSEQHFIGEVNTACQIMQDYSMPKGDQIETKYDVNTNSTIVSFTFYRCKSEKEELKNIKILVYVEESSGKPVRLFTCIREYNFMSFPTPPGYPKDTAK
jgi:hypothetical protein